MNKLKNNIVYNVLYQILVLLVPLITTPYISRVLGEVSLGVFSYVNSVVYYFFIFITLGLANYGNRTIAKCKENHEQRSKNFWAIYKMQLFLGFLILVIYILYLVIFVEKANIIYFSVNIFYLLSACIDVNWFFFGMEDFKFTTIRNTIIKILTIIATFVFVKGDNALLNYFLLFSLSALLSNILLWTKVFKLVKYHKNTFKECVSHLVPNLVLFVPIVAVSIYRVMDKIMIKELSDYSQVGYYENADRVITLSLSFFTAVSTVMMPAISSMVKDNNISQIKIITRDVMQITNFLSIAMFFGMIAISVEFSTLFFGEKFSESGYLLVGLAPVIFLSGWKSVIRSQYIIPFEKDNAYVISLVVAAFINVVVNFVFIPIYGARGAVIGTLVAELIGFIIQTYVAGREINICVIFKDLLLFVIPGFIMCVCVCFLLNILPYNLISVFLGIFIGAIIYSMLVVLNFLIFNRERLIYFKLKFMKK